MTKVLITTVTKSSVHTLIVDFDSLDEAVLAVKYIQKNAVVRTSTNDAYREAVILG